METFDGQLTLRNLEDCLSPVAGGSSVEAAWRLLLLLLLLLLGIAVVSGGCVCVDDTTLSLGSGSASWGFTESTLLTLLLVDEPRFTASAIAGSAVFVFAGLYTRQGSQTSQLASSQTNDDNAITQTSYLFPVSCKSSSSTDSSCDNKWESACATHINYWKFALRPNLLFGFHKPRRWDRRCQGYLCAPKRSRNRRQEQEGPVVTQPQPQPSTDLINRQAILDQRSGGRVAARAIPSEQQPHLTPQSTSVNAILYRSKTKTSSICCK